MSICQVNAENEVTVKNLIAAFECELTAHARCLAFAEQAERECMFEAAILFRAIGRSEKIHADNHARVIRQLGGEPKASIAAIAAKGTVENLSGTLDELTQKVDSMYPRFLVENRSTDNSAARSFTWALEADKENVRLLIDSIKQVQGGNATGLAGAAPEFYVRPVCGYVSRAQQPERCWVCEHFCKTFEVIH